MYQRLEQKDDTERQEAQGPVKEFLVFQKEREKITRENILMMSILKYFKKNARIRRDTMSSQVKSKAYENKIESQRFQF